MRPRTGLDAHPLLRASELIAGGISAAQNDNEYFVRVVLDTMVIASPICTTRSAALSPRRASLMEIWKRR